MGTRIYKIALLLLLTLILSCSGAAVRSTVDSFGEEKSAEKPKFYFDPKDLTLLEQQAADDCKLAAKDKGLFISEKPCPDCMTVVMHTRLTGTEQILRSGPGYGSAWGVFGASGGAGVGFGSANLQASREAGREINLNFYADSAQKQPIRQVQIRSVGRENSVQAVAYEMCEAAFKDYPANLKGQFYEIKYRKTEANAQ